MKIAGIVAEYNPFHKGHQYQINLLRDMGYEGIVAVMSGSFVQRADTALTDKYRRAECAVLGGVDLVIELPLPYAVASAEDFGRGGISVLSATGVVNTVCCGCESGDEKNRRQYDALCQAEKTGKIKEKMQSGLSYPAACKEAVLEMGELWSDQANDVLALAYRKAIDQINSQLKLIAIDRKGSFYGDGTEGFESANSIRRRLFAGEEIFDSIPEKTAEMIKTAPLSRLERLERGILAYYRTADPESLECYYGMREGLPQRICNGADSSLEELYDRVKTKRFPHSAVRRAVLCGYLKLPKVLPEISYLRVLAFNEKGQEILKTMKKTATLPILSSLTHEQKNDPLAQMQLQGDEIFALTLPQPETRYRDRTESARKICQK